MSVLLSIKVQVKISSRVIKIKKKQISCLISDRVNHHELQRLLNINNYSWVIGVLNGICIQL